MINFLLFCFATIGMTNIFVDSNLFSPIRNLIQKYLWTYVSQIFECHQCMGTWCGFICGYILLSTSPLLVLMCGCAGSFLASITYLLFELILSHTGSYYDESRTEEDK